MPISSMGHSVLMHELVKCVYVCTQLIYWKVVCHIISLSQDFCDDPVQFHFGRHGIATYDLHKKVQILY